MSLMVGVSGIRGIVGETLTPQLAVRAGCAMGAFCNGGRVVIGCDSRPSGPMVRSAVVSGLLASGCDVTDLGVVATPSVGLMVRQLQAAGGVMLTASHNPSQWNGIKFISAEGAAPPLHVAQKIIDRFEREAFSFANHQSVGRLQTDDSANQNHVDAVLKIVDVDAICARNFSVVLDSVNGAGGPAGLLLLEKLGCAVVHVNGEANGLFAHTPEPIAENLTDLCGQVASAGADVGFAQDPDADRLAIVDEKGRFIGEEYTLALGAYRVLLTTPGPVCANLSTSRMIDDIAAKVGDACKVYRSAVGEANVVQMMKAHHCVIGGEGNGGLIDPRVVDIRDSLTSMAVVLDLMAAEGKPLSQIVESLPRYAMVKQKFECDRSRIARVLDAVKQKFADARISTTDGVRIDWPQGWVHVRGSNTEPIMRIIGEAEDESAANELIAQVRTVVDSVS